MGATEWDDPHGILPECFRREYRDCESVGEALAKAQQATPDDLDERDRCPNCRSTQLVKKRLNREMSHRVDRRWKCKRCYEHFDEPLAPLAERPVEHGLKWLFAEFRRRSPNQTMPINTPFEWVAPSDLKDPSERTTALSALDDDLLSALAIAAYAPWSDDGPSYRELAEQLPYSRQWVGERVRAWKAGEYRELVADPREQPSVDDTPSVDPFDYGRAVATDGGRRRRRWVSYGRD